MSHFIFFMALFTLGALIFSLFKRVVFETNIAPRKVKAFFRLAMRSIPKVEWDLPAWRRLLSSNVTKIFLLMIGVRLAIYLAAWIFHMGEQGESGQFLNFWTSLDDIWIKWDAPHYLSLAEVGYHPPAQNPLHIVFYPLYPWLVSATNWLVNDMFTAGMLASLAFYMLASCVLYQLVKNETKDSELAFDSVKYLAIFPYSFFFNTVYTESLFLLMTVSCFLFLRSGRWLVAGLFGGLAALTRNQGVLLLIPIVIEAYYQRHIVPLWLRMVAILMTLAGFGGYLLLNWYVFKNPFQFRIAQKSNWQQEFGFFPKNMSNIFQGMLTDDYNMVFGIWLPTIICFFAAVSLLWWGRHRLALSLQAYCLAYVLISFSPTWLLSGPRYMSVLFPLAILLAMWVQLGPVRRQWIDTLLFSSLMLGVYFFTRGWVY